MGISDWTRRLLAVASARAAATSEVTRTGPPAGVVSAAPRGTNRRQLHPGVGADIDRLDSMVRRAEDGYARDLQDFFSDTLDRDARAAAVCRTRCLGVQSRPINIVPPEGYETDKEAVEIAKRVKTILTRIAPRASNPMTCSLRSGVGAMTMGSVRGWTVIEQEWGVTPEGWHAPVALHLRHANRFGFDDELRFVRRDPSDPREGVPLDEWGPDRFIVHIPTGGRGDEYPWRRPVMLPIGFLSLFKKQGVKFWLRATERMGTPLPYAVVPSGMEHIVDEAVAFLRKLANGTSAVLWGDQIKIEQVPGSGDADGTPHKNLIDWIDTTEAILVLGQNLTTEVQSGSFAAANALNTVRLDILGADAGESGDTLSTQTIAPIVKHNWPGAPTPRAVIDTSAQLDWTLDDVKEGVCTEDEYRIAKGRGPKPDGTGSAFRKPASQVQVPASYPAQPPAASAAPPGGAAAGTFRTIR